MTPEVLIYGKVGYTSHKIDVDGDGVDNGVAFKFNDNVWSTSDSSRAAAGAAACVPVGMIWLTCGDCSRSQRRL